mmetsp:Transcript_90256/g.260229  ORF Transcript_90256/g.260229 Transcript_90256/m.260229 type:complete len:215 (-) Transcript_90256:622-1266(-)
MPPPTYTLYTPPGSFRALAPLIAAECNAIDVQVVTENIEEVIAQKSPSGQAPILECSSSKEIVFGSSAMARYLAGLRSDTGLLPAGLVERACVDNWVDWCSAELEVPACVLFYPKVGLMPENAEAMEKAKNDMNEALQVLQNQLTNHQYVVGDVLTLADITIVATLVYPFRLALDPEFLQPFHKVVDWYRQCRSLPEFLTVMGALEEESGSKKD